MWGLASLLGVKVRKLPDERTDHIAQKQHGRTCNITGPTIYATQLPLSRTRSR